ncbi:CapA family protein [Desemzia sp. RIT804]|uniref:CapA family protein n=1 Tax=Desemzia sp. RIT 804 TaxID=2810209 RepID=UPI00194E7CB1|nr:CapA family protein [Desemzia sp. RIT 804]MBM6614672.1 CapA family protein [Desemzia sp. RIT 804]
MKTYLSMLALLMMTGCTDLGVTQDTIELESSFPPESNLESDVESETSESEAEEKRVSFIGVGDNLIHEGIYKDAQTEEGAYDFSPIYQHVKDDIQSADVAFVNQETMLGGDELGFSGYPSFNTPSDMAGNLVEVGFDLINSSSNHSLDKGTAGVLNALEIWSQYEDIIYTGVFKDQEQRDTIPIFEKDGLTFSLLTYTYGTNGIEPEYPYLVNYFSEEVIAQDVKRAKEISDVVLVSAHWGDEHTFAPNVFQQQYAQLFADLGVDVVFGTHPHTIQPVEWVQGEDGNKTLVIYSLGNFLAATTSDINLLGGMVAFDVVQQEDQETQVENIKWTPLVIYYENEIAGNVDTRGKFAVYKLEDYTDELVEKHGLTGIEDNDVSIKHYKQLIKEVIDPDFLDEHN